ncbi:MAG: DUF2474 domain-containing protein [Hyphomonadaceae bacterium]|nr:DUF2474 domain-containing protein [Hyphomonadaceae bacterium]MBC6411609.1 DUF2474 domain-containing protein [Hyphomonadaceae bacterium]
MGRLFKPVPPPEDGETRSLMSRLLWFAAISACGVAAVASAAYGLRHLLLM